MLVDIPTQFVGKIEQVIASTNQDLPDVGEQTLHNHFQVW